MQKKETEKIPLQIHTHTFIHTLNTYIHTYKEKQIVKTTSNTKKNTKNMHKTREREKSWMKSVANKTKKRILFTKPSLVIEQQNK